jgi:predicted lipoprotein
MDRLLVRQVLAVSGLGALAFVLLDAGGPILLSLTGVVVALVAAVGVIGLVRVVVISERERARR